MFFRISIPVGSCRPVLLFIVMLYMKDAPLTVIGWIESFGVSLLFPRTEAVLRTNAE